MSAAGSAFTWTSRLLVLLLIDADRLPAYLPAPLPVEREGWMNKPSSYLCERCASYPVLKVGIPETVAK